MRWPKHCELWLALLFTWRIVPVLWQKGCVFPVKKYPITFEQGKNLSWPKIEFFVRWWFVPNRNSESDITALKKQIGFNYFFLNHHNKNKEIKSPIILEYSLDKTTAPKIKTLSILHVGKCKLFMNTAPYQFLFQMVLCRVGNNSRAWRKGAGICLVFKMKKETKKKGASFYKQFGENYNSVWDQFSPGAKNRINRQYTKAEMSGFCGNYILGYL